MKRFLVLFLFTSIGYGQALTKNEVNQQIALVWGLLKYHHPDVSRGKFDWDRELLVTLENSGEVSDQKELNEILLQLCTKVNTKKTRFREKENSPGEELFRKNEDYGWIQEYAFSENLRGELIKLKQNSRIGDYYASSELLNNFLNFDNEKGQPNFDHTKESHRLLLLYNFWNTIQYWYVNKYLMDENWRDALPALTAEFADATTTEKFELAKLKMISKLNDSHSYRTSSFLWDSIFNHFPAFNGKLVNDSLVITRTIKTKSGIHTNLQPGDIITGINDLPVEKYIEKRFTPLISASNKNYLRGRIQKWFLLSDNSDSLKVTVHSPGTGVSSEQYIPLYSSFGKIDSAQKLYNPPKEKWYDLTPEVTYINLDSIQPKELKTAFGSAKENKAIILDLRNYPSFIRDKDLSQFLYPRKKKYLKVLFPLEGEPSYGDPDGKAPLRFILDPFKTGRKNKDYFKGKVVLLVDRNTMSKAEYLAMVIQQAPNCVTVGEQTAGAPLNIWTYTLADGQTASFTGLGGFYPNGVGVQRTGVAIDHQIEESALHYDPELYIKKALEIIEDDFEDGNLQTLIMQ